MTILDVFLKILFTVVTIYLIGVTKSEKKHLSYIVKNKIFKS